MSEDISELLSSDLDELLRLRRRAIRAKVWHMMETSHRATIGVLNWIRKRKVTGLLDRAEKNRKVRGMMDAALSRMVELLKSKPWALPPRIRCFLKGLKISQSKSDVYEENGVFSWAPWARKWLEESETLFYFGATMKWGIG